MFTACESGRELVSDAGTARRRQTENKAVKPHAVYVELRKQGGKESVSRGSGAVVTSERHAATCVLRFFLVFFFVARTVLGGNFKGFRREQKTK